MSYVGPRRTDTGICHLRLKQQAHVINRSELANVPGSWTYFISEYTDQLRLTLDLSSDPSLAANVIVRPHGEEAFENNIYNRKFDYVILPGQAIQIRFFKKDNGKPSEGG